MGGLESDTIGGFNGMIARQLLVTLQRIMALDLSNELFAKSKLSFVNIIEEKQLLKYKETISFIKRRGRAYGSIIQWIMEIIN